MKYLFLLFTISFQAQVLHHQMISAQGVLEKMPDGTIIRQTIGQQSVIGNSDNENYVVIQGFQQNLWGKYTSSNMLGDIKTVAYPNPFIETINFQFSKPITDVINVHVFDILGRLIFKQNKKLNDSILTIDLSLLPNSEYLVRLNTIGFNYYTKIIKQ
jgi:hypothetical protein